MSRSCPRPHTYPVTRSNAWLPGCYLWSFSGSLLEFVKFVNEKDAASCEVLESQLRCQSAGFVDMKLIEPAFTIGVEEEYLLVDLGSRDLVADPPPELMQACVQRCGEQVSPELMRAQIEVGTPVCGNVSEARHHVKRLRNIIAEEADKFGFAPVAVSSHPFASWQEQKQTARDRYSALTREMQAAARRMLIVACIFIQVLKTGNSV